MCGIAGVWHFERERFVSEPVLKRMISTLQHRGPDANNVKILGNVGFGFSRLSIIDPTGDLQPFYDNQRNVCLVINGEIYNYQTLRAELAQFGHEFITNGDSETVLSLYLQYGPSLVDHINGMFAFAIWDGSKNQLTVAVDPFGKKPLYYALASKQIVFASEIKAIMQYPGISRSLDLAAMDEYFTYGCIGGERSIFQSIRKVPPGHMIIFDSSGKRIVKQYWEPSFPPKDNLIKRPLPELAEELLVLLRQAVARRMVSDVPVGAFLSGGVDSSAIVTLMKQLSTNQFPTFSVGFSEAEFDESPFAQAVADHVGTDHHFQMITPDLETLLIKLAYQFDEPYADSSAIPTYCVSRLASEHVKVVLSGDGGDEIFAGYKAYQYAYQAAFNRANIRLTVPGLESEYRDIDKFPIEESYTAFYANERLKLFAPHLHVAQVGEKLKIQSLSKVMHHDLLTQLQYVDLTSYLPFDILTKVDRASMFASLEVRCPFLDKNIFDFMTSIPPENKYNGFETKIILKRAIENFLPPGILDRRKCGFSIPLVKWIDGPLKTMVRDLLFGQRVKERGLFNMSYVREFYESNERSLEHANAIWALVCFELWARNYLDTPILKAH